MKSKFNSSRSAITLAALCGVALGVGVIVFRAQADEWDKKTILTVDQPIQITDTYLEPGTYVLKLANSSSNRNIVQIFNRDQNHLINTVMAIPNYRIRPTGKSQFVFWETPPGRAPALRAWFYPGDDFGQEFRYPKEPRLLAVAATATAPPAPAPEIAQAPVPAPPAPPVVQEQTQEEQQSVETAQNNAPPPPAPEAAPSPAPSPSAEEPETLPKTASPYPLIGLAGLASLGLYAMLRMKRSA